MKKEFTIEERKYALGKMLEELGIMEEDTFSDMIGEIEQIEGKLFSYGLDEYLVLTESELEKLSGGGGYVSVIHRPDKNVIYYIYQVN